LKEAPQWFDEERGDALQRDIHMMPVPPLPNPYLNELRVKERMIEREQNTPMFSRRSALIGIAIVLILVVAGLVILYAFH